MRDSDDLAVHLDSHYWFQDVPGPFGGTMYATIRRFSTNRDMEETLRRADHDYARAVERQIGFVDYQIVRTGSNEAISILLFETREEDNRNGFFSRAFREVGLAGLDVDVLDEWRGEVQVSSASDLALRRVHAA